MEKQDALQQLAQLIRDAQTREPLKTSSRLEALTLLTESINQALETKDTTSFGILGRDISQELDATLSRLSALRSLFQRKPLQIGEESKISLPSPTFATLKIDGASPDLQTPPRELYVRDQFVTEFLQLKPDFNAEDLEGALNSTMESLLKKEEGMAKTLLRASTESKKEVWAYDELHFIDLLKSRNFSTLWASNTFMNKMVSSITLSEAFVATKSPEEVLIGHIGTLYGVQLILDAFHPSQCRVINQGEMFLVPRPEVLGKLLVRQTLDAEPCESFILGSRRIGWMVREIIAPVVLDSSSIVCLEF